MNTVRTSLLDHYKSIGTPPPDAETAARALGLRLVSPHAHAWPVVQDFVDAYCRDLVPAGVLVVASDPVTAGGADTGIPFTDAEHARRELALTCAGTTRSDSADLFWRIVRDVRGSMGQPTLEGLFSAVHLVHAFPYAPRVTEAGGAPAGTSGIVAGAPALERVTREHLARVLALTRPQAVACVGRFAWEAAAACADNRHALAAELSEGPWATFVARHSYDPGLRAFPKADFGSFRARLVPVDASPELVAHAEHVLGNLIADAWT